MATVRLFLSVLILIPSCHASAGLLAEGEDAKPPDFAYCMWTHQDVEHAEEIFQSLKGTPCTTIFVCPMFELEKWDSSTIRPAPKLGLHEPAAMESLVLRARELGFTVVLQPNLTIDPSREPQMLPNYNPWWQQFAHTSQATWEAWTRILEAQAEIAERAGAQYLVCLHEADELLIYPGWREFLRNRLRKIAPSVKLVYSQHGMQHLRLRYERRLNMGLWAFRIGRTRFDKALAAADMFELVGRSDLSPTFALPKDRTRRRQLGQDLLNAWVKYQPCNATHGEYPYLELVRDEFDAYKSSDYWPVAYQEKDREGMAAIYRAYRFVAEWKFLGWRPRCMVRFAEEQKATKRLFGEGKPWFRETGLEALPPGADYGKLVLPFVQATRDAWRGFTDCIVWWGNGYDRAFLAAMQAMKEDK